MHSSVQAGRKMSRLFSVVLAMAMLVMMVPGALAGAAPAPTLSESVTWYVDPVGGDDGNGGTSAVDAFASITMAVSEAGYGDTIMLAEGEYVDEDYPIYVGTPLDFVGAGADKSVLDAEGMSNLFFVDETSATFEGMSFVNGESGGEAGPTVQMDSSQGGAVCIAYSEVTFTDCLFADNTSFAGGAIAAIGSDVVVDGCSFIDNGVLPPDSETLRSLITDELPSPEPAFVVCEVGGAIYAVNGGSLDVLGSHFLGNQAYESGSAIFTGENDLSVDGSVFDANSISRWGDMRDRETEAQFEGVSAQGPPMLDGDGTVTSVFGTVDVTESEFYDNLAFAGGGILTIMSIVNVGDCVFEDNITALGAVTSFGDDMYASVSEYAGTAGADVAEFIEMSTTTVERCEVTGQLAGYSALTFEGISSAQVINCLIADNNGLDTGIAFEWVNWAGVANTTIANNDAYYAVACDTGDYGAARSAGFESYAYVTNSILWDGYEASAVGCNVYASDLMVGIGDPPLPPEDTAVKALVGSLPPANNIYADPMFASPAGGNYRLVAGSPCIDTGVYLQGFSDDLDGLLRPVDGNNDTVEEWDMGCYEYFSRTKGRVSGRDRYETAVEISRDHFDESNVVVLATGRTFADGLSASGLAGVYNAPLLLSDASYLPAVVATEIERLGASTVIVVGGTSAVSGAVAAQLELMDIAVERIGGTNRYETAALIAEEILALDPNAGDLMFIARGDLFADALTASPVAYANHAPVLLVHPNELPAATVDIVESLSDGNANIVVVGGTSAVGAGVAAQVDATDRIEGVDRFDTAASFSLWATDNGYARWNVTGVATGLDFPDALSGGAGIGSQNGVLLLTPGSSVHPSVDDVLTDWGSSVLRLQLFGGENAVSELTKAALMNYLP